MHRHTSTPLVLAAVATLGGALAASPIIAWGDVRPVRDPAYRSQPARPVDASLAAILEDIERLARDLDRVNGQSRSRPPREALATAGLWLERSMRLREALQEKLEHERAAVTVHTQALDDRLVTLQALASRLDAVMRVRGGARPQDDTEPYSLQPPGVAGSRAAAARRVSRFLVGGLARDGRARLRDKLESLESRQRELAARRDRLDSLELRVGGLLQTIEQALAQGVTALAERPAAHGDLVERLGPRLAIDGQRIEQIAHSLQESQRALLSLLESHVDELERQANTLAVEKDNPVADGRTRIDIATDEIRSTNTEHGGSP